MLAKKHRLTREQFSGFFKSGKRYHSKYATLIVTNHDCFHGSVVVSKKVSKKAVTRNTIRRRVYAQLYGAFSKQKTGVYIVVVKPLFTSLSRKLQHREVTALIDQVK